jgi:transcriptional regulator with XRE-family HTH domain
MRAEGRDDEELTWSTRAGAHLKATRLAAGLRRIDLANQVGVSEETVRLWEKGAVQPSPERLAKLIAVTALSADGWRALRGQDAPELPPLARRLRAEREARGMTQAEAVQVLGVPQATYAAWETGRTTPLADLFGTIAEFLGMAEHEVEAICETPFVVDTTGWPTFGRLLGERRQALRLTRPELAEAVGVTAGTVVAWELGYRVPGATQLPGLAAALAVDSAELASALPQRGPASSLGQLIVARQRELGLRSNDVARELGAAEATVSRWVNGKSRPGARNLRRLSDVLKVPYASIVEAAGGVA